MNTTEKAIRHREAQAKYRDKNKDALAVKKAEWYSINRNTVLEKMADHRAKNPSFDCSTKAAWKKQNPEKNRMHKKNHKFRKASSGTLSHDVTTRLLSLQKNSCVACKTNLLDSGFHIDHVVALAVGGLNIDSNIQLLCPTCNKRKATKHSIDFMRTFGYLI